MPEFQPWMHPEWVLDPTPQPPLPVPPSPPREQGEHPVVAPLNERKMQFMLDYFVAAKHSGHGDHYPSDRDELVDIAVDLFDKAVANSRGD